MTRRSASLNAAASEPPAARPPSSSGAPWLPTNSPVTVRAPFAQHTPAPPLIKHNPPQDLPLRDGRRLLHYLHYAQDPLLRRTAPHARRRDGLARRLGAQAARPRRPDLHRPARP